MPIGHGMVLEILRQSLNRSVDKLYSGHFRTMHICAYLFHLYHVVLGNPFCDAHNQTNLGLHGFHNGLGSRWRRHIDNRRVALRDLLGLQKTM